MPPPCRPASRVRVLIGGMAIGLLLQLTLSRGAGGATAADGHRVAVAGELLNHNLLGRAHRSRPRPRRAAGARAVSVGLRGEPKSGTTWVEMILVTAVKVACHPDARTGCRLLIPFDVKSRAFEIEVDHQPASWGEAPNPPRRQRVRYTMKEKHQLPLAARGCMVTKRGPGVVWHSPQCPKAGGKVKAGGNGHLSPGSVVHDDKWVAADAAVQLDKCLTACYDAARLGRAGEAATERFIHIQRDPRDLAISDCFWTKNRRKGWLQTPPGAAELGECAFDRLMVLSPWMKLRELWFHQLSERKVPVLHICYEDLVASVEGHRRLIEGIGINLTDAELRAVMELTSPEALRVRDDVATGRDAHGTRPISEKVRTGPNKRFSDYGLAASTIAQMNAIVRIGSFGWFLPVGAGAGSWNATGLFAGTGGRGTGSGAAGANAVATTARASTASASAGGGVEGTLSRVKVEAGRFGEDFAARLRALSLLQLGHPTMVVIYLCVGLVTAVVCTLTL